MSDSTFLLKERSRVIFVSLVLLLAITFWTLRATRAAVALLYFRGYSQVGGILLVWETEAEPDNQGFYITRSDTENGNYLRVSEFIPALGSDTTGDYYTYIDPDIVGGVAYWYQLEMLDVDNLVTFSDKIRVFAGLYVSTPTATSTAVSSSSTPTIIQPTFTATQGVQATSLVTPSPDATLTSLQETPPGLTEVVTATEILSATATLIPLPDITLQFPTPELNPDPARLGADTIPENPAEERGRLLLIKLGRALFLALIVLIWVVLGVWFYMSNRRLE